MPLPASAPSFRPGEQRRTGCSRLVRLAAGVVAMVLFATASPGVPGVGTAAAAPVGQGFNLNASDLRFIMKQIGIAERHVAGTTSATGLCGGLFGHGPDGIEATADDQIPENGVGVTLPWGLRTVDGTCNNIVKDQAEFGSADRPFPRLVPRSFRPGYGEAGNVTDAQPRVISNLIVDQTASNPAAVEAAGPTPESRVTTASGAFFIPNVAPDVGLSAPYNSWFTLFGQFFDHGLDLVNKGGTGTVTVPLQSDDPLIGQGPPFMTLTRASHSGDMEASNQTSPWIDQSQTYSSHPSHQVFLREYELIDGKPVGTGRMITGTGDGMADWKTVKAQARDILGIALTDMDVLNVPTLLTDPYGHFVRGTNGFPQLVLTGGGTREGSATAPIPTEGAIPTGHAFLDDMAHTAVPSAAKVADSDGVVNDRNTRPSSTSYDDEMLDAHFVAGDGRVNENIGLITVHHVFHSEHNRLTVDIADRIATDPALSQAERDAWRVIGPAGWDYGERLFQAARFVTEMEYQHLAFEEFARKVQPMVNLFGEGGTGYRTDVDPAISAEFAHAVYRFGHSMLNESVDRVAASGARRDVSLLDAFLNPPMFLDGGTNPDAAAGDVVRGMTRQTGNELDEFVTEALRNELLGLPLDLASLNLARARDTGIPGLNAARRTFFAQTSDSGLRPYTSWADFGFSLKHQASLVNFIAAYGTHGSITSVTSLTDKRSAAQALLDVAGAPEPSGSTLTEEQVAALRLQQEDARAFLNSTAPYESGGSGVTTTGVDGIDLWVGGLAEKQMVFGGLLGPTFNHVFERQMENLQDSDRFYYLSRTVGLNLLTQLEGNSFSELIQRNTDVEGLPADSFSRPGLVFDLSKQSATGAIVDDADTEYREPDLLVREPDGTIRYGGPEHAVFNGTPGADRVSSSEGDDTIRGNAGNDRMEGGDGNDNLIGGEGDDIMTDLAGDDVLKGGDGDDALSSGRGFGGDLNQGGLGNDFIVGGNDMTESFAGPGNDFVFAGEAQDAVFGDDGDDWIEGGKGPFNLLQGDNGAPFQDDPNEPGHDVLFSYGGEQDYDAEGGDDIMLVGPGIQRSEGMLGFDWTSHKSDPQAGTSDMRITGFLPPSVDANRDRFDLVESMSGWSFNDVLRGDDRDAAAMAGHELTAQGINRIDGLSALLDGATSFTGGNILIGGAGDDVVEGRGGNDLIDGDAWLDVQLEVRSTAGLVVRRADTMSELQVEVFAGRLDPGNISIVRTIRAGAPGTDTASFSGARAEYDITTVGAGRTLVVHRGGTAVDGTDTLRNVEKLQFSDGTVDVPSTDVAAPTVTTTTPAGGAAVVSALADVTATFSENVLGVDGTTFTLRAGTGTTPLPATVTFDGTTRTATLNPTADLAPVTTFTAELTGGPRAIRDVAGNPLTTTVWTFTTGAAGDRTPPTVTLQTPAPGTAGLRASIDVIAQFSEPVVGVDTTSFTLANAANTPVAATVTFSNPVGAWVLNPSRNLPNGTYTVRLTNAIRDTATSPNPLAPLTWTFTVGAATPPGGGDTTAPTITGRSPAPGATGVGRTGDVAVTFSEAVTGVGPTTFLLKDTALGTTVPSRLSSSGGTQWRLRPSASLAAGRQYTVQVMAGIADDAGNPLVPESWSFTTR